MIPSPYQDDIDKLGDEQSYFEFYDELPATSAWLRTIGAALGTAFGIAVTVGAEEWEIDHPSKEMRTGSIEAAYSRRGILGLLLNGIGRLAFGEHFPTTTKQAKSFAKVHKVKKEAAKHFGALVRVVDELRTDDRIAHEYAGGMRVVDTMHAQAYEGAQEQLRLMALDMKIRKEMTRVTMDYCAELHRIAVELAKLPIADVSSKNSQRLQKDAQALFTRENNPEYHSALQVSVWGSSWMHNDIKSKNVFEPGGRVWAAILIALYPQDINALVTTLIRSYDRNHVVFGGHMSYMMVSTAQENEILATASDIHDDLEELKQLASHHGGHAQYVLAKAEQYYHGSNLGIPMATPYLGYDMEARALDVEAANDSARELAQAMKDRGYTTDVSDSIDFAKELLPLIEQYPFLDLNDRQKNDDGGNGSMSQRVMGAGKESPKKEKRQKEREKKSDGDRSKDRRKMEAKDNKKNQEKVDQERGGYSILDAPNIDPLDKYLYLIGPYLNRIAATAQKMRRILKVNEPMGMRGAYRRGKELNPKVLYRHRLGDYRLFARKEVDKDVNYGFVLMGDLSSSTEHSYSDKHNRQIEDEILASAFIITEVAERIGDKVMCAVGFFSNGADTAKRAGFYLNRSKILTDIKGHGGGTNVDAAGGAIEEDLAEMEEFKVKDKSIIFITDGDFDSGEFLATVQAAKKYKASIAYFSIAENSSGVGMCKEVEKFVHANAKGVRIRTRNIPPNAIATLPEAIAQLMKETIIAKI